MSLKARKPVLMVSDKVMVKQAYSVTKTSKSIEILYKGSLILHFAMSENKGADQVRRMCRLISLLFVARNNVQFSRIIILR